MLQHLLGMEVCNQEGDIVSLGRPSTSVSVNCRPEQRVSTLMGFLRRIKKDSARCVKKRVNLWTRICSISSACLILMLIRMLFIDGSIKTRSFSLRATVKGVRSTSGDVRASTSGTLCRSAVWDAKLERQSAAVKLLRTAWRYGRRDCDYVGENG